MILHVRTGKHPPRLDSCLCRGGRPRIVYKNVLVEEFTATLTVSTGLLSIQTRSKSLLQQMAVLRAKKDSRNLHTQRDCGSNLPRRPRTQYSATMED